MEPFQGNSLIIVSFKNEGILIILAQISIANISIAICWIFGHSFLLLLLFLLLLNVITHIFDSVGSSFLVLWVVSIFLVTEQSSGTPKMSSCLNNKIFWALEIKGCLSNFPNGQNIFCTLGQNKMIRGSLVHNMVMDTTRRGRLYGCYSYLHLYSQTDFWTTLWLSFCLWKCR